VFSLLSDLQPSGRLISIKLHYYIKMGVQTIRSHAAFAFHFFIFFNLNLVMNVREVDTYHFKHYGVDCTILNRNISSVKKLYLIYHIA
jgi:hypothetical protein